MNPALPQSGDADALYRDWQEQVQAHAALLLRARNAGLAPQESHPLEAEYLWRIDNAYRRWKLAASPQAFTSPVALVPHEHPLLQLSQALQTAGLSHS